jgi:hypothetical protein
MDEMYRMLGREHEADLEREARRWQRAAEVRGRRRGAASTSDFLRGRTRVNLALARVGAFVLRAARVEA